MEQKRNALRHVHESVSGKSFDSSVHSKLFEILLCLFASYSQLCYIVEKSASESRVKELEEMLAARDAEVKMIAESASAREEQFVDRVAFLARNMRGEYSLCLSCTLIPLCLMFLCL